MFVWVYELIYMCMCTSAFVFVRVYKVMHGSIELALGLICLISVETFIIIFQTVLPF